jgi:hypothetical protein
MQIKRYKEFRVKLKRWKKEGVIEPETYQNAKYTLHVLKANGLFPDKVHTGYDNASQAVPVYLVFSMPFLHGFCVIAKKDCIHSVSYELEHGTLARKSYNVSRFWLVEACRAHESTQQIAVKKK